MEPEWQTQVALDNGDGGLGPCRSRDFHSSKRDHNVPLRHETADNILSIFPTKKNQLVSGSMCIRVTMVYLNLKLLQRFTGRQFLEVLAFYLFKQKLYKIITIKIQAIKSICTHTVVIKSLKLVVIAPLGFVWQCKYVVQFQQQFICEA